MRLQTDSLGKADATLPHSLAAWLVGLLIISAPMVAHAQPWSGILDPSRAIDWSSAGVSGGIPTRTTICATLNPGATAVQINSAISSCPASQVVFLKAGTYNLSSGVDFGATSNVTLRGAGGDQTKLVFSGRASCFFSVGAAVCLSSGENNYGPNGGLHTANWTAGYAKGATVITLSNTTGLTVGNHLMLDQLDDASDGYPAIGDLYVCETCSKQGGNNFGRSGRSQLQVVTVTAINGSNVTISPGLYMPNWRSSQSPGAWWGNRTIKNSGVENLSIDITSTGSPGIMFFNALNCWVKGVRVVEAGSPSSTFSYVRLMNVGRITIRDSYFYGPTTQTTDTYGITAELASDLLVENNIIQWNPGALEQNGSDSGSVWAYNFHVGSWVNTVTEHEAGVGMVLYEGNSGTGLTADIIHGSGNFITQFRNHWYGGTSGITGGTVNWLASDHRFYNVIGNVLGMTTDAIYEANVSVQTGREIFSLGEDNAAITGTSVPFDARVKATLMRWGNYDTVTGTSRFVANEVPSGLSQFANPVPASQNLPASLYLSGQPTAWWGTPWGIPAWPAVGPDVSNGNISGWGGHANKIPARLCYENSTIDSAYGSGNVRVFNAGTCYVQAAGQVPAPPTMQPLR
ncbi:MAG: hypothetical protein DMG76_29475 [Acidobacteria bacterium]|nr:MAG: hypothetical protein DMG76_29475 [Acidobacteriota bacterium]